ncbi:MAG: hypothetical protein AABO57_25020 [Acidobacteriota bacterium]
MQRQARFVVGGNITYPLLTKWVWSSKRFVVGGDIMYSLLTKWVYANLPVGGLRD